MDADAKSPGEGRWVKCRHLRGLGVKNWQNYAVFYKFNDP